MAARAQRGGVLAAAWGAALALGLFSGAAPAAAEARAVVVGVNAYEHLGRLDGAVADAEDIDRVLAGVGVRDRTLLLDGAATRARVMAAWAGALSRSRPGDILVLTFAGHGVQIPDKNGDEEGPDDAVFPVDEALAFAGFHANGPDPMAAALLDDEINAFLHRAERAGVAVLFIADACFSGELTRSAAISPWRPKVRSGGVAVPSDLALPDLAYQPPPPPPRFSRNVLFLAAAAEDQPTFERVIPGEETPRGPLSFTVARALEGAADGNSDGYVSWREFLRYVRRVMPQYGGYSLPSAEGRGEDDAPVLPAPLAAAGAGAAPEEGAREEDAREEDALRLRVTAGTAPEGLADVALVSGAAPADLIWNAETGEAIGPGGDVLSESVAPSELQGLVDKLRLVGLLQEAAAARPLALDYGREDSGFSGGDLFDLAVGPLPAPYLTALNLDKLGDVDFLVPHPLFPGEGGPHPEEHVQVAPDVCVEPPWGTDHVVAIATAEPPEALRLALEAGVNADALTPLIRELVRAGAAVGVRPLFSREGEGPCWPR